VTLFYVLGLPGSRYAQILTFLTEIFVEFYKFSTEILRIYIL